MAKLEARVRQDYFLAHISAFSGLEFVKSEWRPVPDGMEEQARKHEILEIREVKQTPVSVPAAHYVAPSEFDTEKSESDEESKPRRGRRRKTTEEDE